MILSLAATPVLSTSAAAFPGAPALSRPTFTPAAVVDETLLAELEAARRWAATRPTRAHALPTSTLSATTQTATPASTGHAEPVKRKPSPKPATESGNASTTTDAGRVSAVVSYALAQIGKPYRFATAGPDTFDCSGLAKAAYSVVGITIPHQTGGIIKRGHAVSQSQLQPGDLVFPSSGHVGIYIGGGLMVHAPKPGDHVEKSKIYSFWAARRLL